MTTINWWCGKTIQLIHHPFCPCRCSLSTPSLPFSLTPSQTPPPPPLPFSSLSLPISLSLPLYKLGVKRFHVAGPATVASWPTIWPTRWGKIGHKVVILVLTWGRVTTCRKLITLEVFKTPHFFLNDFLNVSSVFFFSFLFYLKTRFNVCIYFFQYPQLVCDFAEIIHRKYSIRFKMMVHYSVFTKIKNDNKWVQNLTILLNCPRN